MSVNVTFYCQQITWNGNTWNKTGPGGPLQCRYEHGGSGIGDRTGDAEYPMFRQVVDKDLRVTIRLREVKQTFTLGDFTGPIVLTLSNKSGTTTVTFADMVLEDVRGMQGRATPGDVELIFSHESTDGTTVPVS